MPDNVYSILNGRKTEKNSKSSTNIDLTQNEKYTISSRATDGLNVRFLPNVSTGTVISKIPSGTFIYKISQEKEWFYIYEPNEQIFGWVNSNFLTKV